MKAQFKYSFMAGLHTRGIVFAVIFVMNFVFILLGSLNLLSFAAQVTAVSLGGTAIAVMLVFNILGDIAVFRRMFAAPGAYLHGLTPVPRWKTLMAGVTSVTVMDVVTMTVVIVGEVWMSLILADGVSWGMIYDGIRANTSEILFGLWLAALLLAGYLLIMMIIMFSITMKQSVFYHLPAGGFISVLSAIAVSYIISLSALVLAPFGTVSRWGIFVTIDVGRAGIIAYFFLTLIEAAALFVLTSRLMERKLNI